MLCCMRVWWEKSLNSACVRAFIFIFQFSIEFNYSAFNQITKTRQFLLELKFKAEYIGYNWMALAYILFERRTHEIWENATRGSSTGWILFTHIRRWPHARKVIENESAGGSTVSIYAVGATAGCTINGAAKS